MAVPKKRMASASRDARRSHHALRQLVLTSCQRCHKPVPPHVACPNCGTYQGREVIDVLAKLNKKDRKAKKKARQGQ